MTSASSWLHSNDAQSSILSITFVLKIKDTVRLDEMKHCGHNASQSDAWIQSSDQIREISHIKNKTKAKPVISCLADTQLIWTTMHDAWLTNYSCIMQAIEVPKLFRREPTSTGNSSRQVLVAVKSQLMFHLYATLFPRHDDEKYLWVWQH